MGAIFQTDGRAGENRRTRPYGCAAMIRPNFDGAGPCDDFARPGSPLNSTRIQGRRQNNIAVGFSALLPVFGSEGNGISKQFGSVR